MILLSKVFLKLWVVNGQNIIDVPERKMKQICFLLLTVESKDFMNSATYEWRKMSLDGMG